MLSNDKENLRTQILKLVQEYWMIEIESPSLHANRVSVSGKKLESQDLVQTVDSVLDGWFTSGRFHKSFEKKLANYLGVRKSLFVNSGSSANLLAISSLTSPKLGKKRLLPGDEVITVAAGFPTTVAPIIQNRLVPVFVDIDPDTLNVDVSALEKAIGPKTKAIALAHTLGNPFEATRIREIADTHKLWLVEDNCDALGSEIEGIRTGSFGHFSTQSFYPAHHITSGEGGSVSTKSPQLKKIAESFRDWGRDCWCETGKDNTCKKRFGWQLGDLPEGYDHKYTYTHLGYNLKATDMQAALGDSQIDRVDEFVSARRENFEYLNSLIQDIEELKVCQPTKGSKPSWFGFPITLSGALFGKRRDLINFLDENGIDTRLVFAGNLTKQPAFQDVEYRISGSLVNTDMVMNNSFWVGIHPSLTKKDLERTASALRDGVSKLRST